MLPFGFPRCPTNKGWKTIRTLMTLVLLVTMACDSPTGPMQETIFRLTEPPARRKNLILISLEATRGNLLDPTLRGEQLTPFFDQLAREATQFGQTIAPSNSTIASNTSLLSGQYPATHGVPDTTRRLPASLPILPQFLRRAGYSTAAAVTQNPRRDAGSGFARGFDAYWESTAASSATVQTTFDSGIEWIERNHKKLFFLFLDPGKGSATYAAAMRASDRGLERLFTQLKRLDLLEDTLVVITSDRGEGFDDHGRWDHANAVYDEVLRVPLLFWSHGQVPAGRSRAGLVSLVDVLPTVLDLLGLPTPPKIAGRSLVGAIHGDPLPGNRTRFAEISSPGRALVIARTDEHKWIWQNTDPVLRVYDLRNKPGETNPVDDPALLHRGRVLIDAYRDLTAQP